jgi:serine/threonine-protein kinase
MTPRDVAALVSQIAKGLGKAHQVGVIHRDIKPENIFLCDGEGGEMFVKLLDFGIAKRPARIESSATTTGAVIGTPYYMSPEQIVGEELDARTDIWSLGVVVFEALTGQRPFDGATVGAITLALHTTKPRITALVPELPPALDAWFATACARSPKDRFPTAREAAQALTEAAGETVGPSLLRAPMASSPNLDEFAPSATGDGRESERRLPAGDRAVTNLSSSYGVHSSQRRKKPPFAILAGAVAIVVVLGVLVVFAALRKSQPEDTTTASSGPTVTTPTTEPPRAPLPITDPPAGSASSTMVTSTPSSAPSALASATPTAAKTAVGKRPIAPATTHPKTPTKKSNDDDIK